MKTFLFLMIASFAIFFISCGDDTPSDKICDPACNAWETCNDDGKCDLNAGRCNKDEDCKDVAGKTKCSIETHECVADVAPECTVDADCTDSAKPVCDDGTCVADVAPECTVDADCTDSAKPVCDDGTCVADTTVTCTPDEKRCNADNTAVETCNTAGDAWESVDCAVGEVCVGIADSTMCKNIPDSTITDVRAGTIDEYYTTSGTVTAIVDNGFFFQDAAAGIFVYMGNDYAPTDVAVAKEVKVTGQLSEYSNFMELKYATVIITGDGTLPSPAIVNADAMGEAYESMYISMNGQPFTVTEVATHDFTITDKNGKTFFLKNTDLTASLIVGKVLSKLDGVVTQYSSKYSLNIREAGDMDIVEFTCNSGCDDWEMCSGTNECTLLPGRCDDQGDGCEAGYACNATVCELEGSNDVLNGDFEIWTDDNTATSWTSKSGLTIEKETTLINGGTAAAKITRLDGVGNSSAQFNSDTMVYVTPGNTYSISTYVLDNDSNVNLKTAYAWYDINGDYISNKYAATASSDDPAFVEYTEITEEAPADAFFIGVFFRVYKDGGTTGTVYLDDVTITEQ